MRTRPEFRIYGADDTFRADGYPIAWDGIKEAVRADAGHRCERCLHPYRPGTHGTGEWSRCDPSCRHGGPGRLTQPDGRVTVHEEFFWPEVGLAIAGEIALPPGPIVEARWRILTVHHLNGKKEDCRWWNLAALCQRCHLAIQGRVNLAQVWPHEHSAWFKPHAAGYYASAYLGEDLGREEAMGRMDELLALELSETR